MLSVARGIQDGNEVRAVCTSHQTRTHESDVMPDVIQARRTAENVMHEKRRKGVLPDAMDVGNEGVSKLRTVLWHQSWGTRVRQQGNSSGEGRRTCHEGHWDF
jgi:hypothetical protein